MEVSACFKDSHMPLTPPTVLQRIRTHAHRGPARLVAHPCITLLLLLLQEGTTCCTSTAD